MTLPVELVEAVARSIALRVGYMGVLDNMPPGDPEETEKNAAWVGLYWRAFVPSAVAAILALRTFDNSRGMKTVPREPSVEMMEAGYAHVGYGDSERKCWVVMWDAAPGKEG